MQITAKAQYIRMSPKKVRKVADVIRDKNINEATAQLRFLGRSACKPMEKLLNSVVANAKHNFQAHDEDLFIKEIRVDGGPTLKRWRPRAFGRASTILKRSSHINITLGSFRELKPINKEKQQTKNSENAKPKVTDKKTKTDKKAFDASQLGKQHRKEQMEHLHKKAAGGGVKRFFQRNKTD